MHNALTIDVEDYFQVTAFTAYVKREDWDKYRPRVVEDTLKILDLLDTHEVRSTFFVLGWVAAKFPSLIKEIHNRGHEIASHGYGHQLIYEMGPDKFRDDIRTSKKLLEDICGDRVIGYRAPSFSITNKSLWALEILVEEGFLYDSSIFPIVHDVYGIPDAQRFPCDLNVGEKTIREFPISTIEFQCVRSKCRIPVGGGGYLRLFPLFFLRRAYRYINQKESQPVIIYFHPWEIDPHQPVLKAGIKAHLRHYAHIGQTINKIKNLLGSFCFTTMRELLMGTFH